MDSQDYRLVVGIVMIELQNIQLSWVYPSVVIMPVTRHMKLNRTVDFIMDIIVLEVIQKILCLLLFGKASIMIMFTVLQSLIWMNGKQLNHNNYINMIDRNNFPVYFNVI